MWRMLVLATVSLMKRIFFNANSLKTKDNILCSKVVFTINIAA